MQIRQRLKEKMKENCLSAPKLSESSGVPLGSLKSILNGQSKNPTVNTLMSLAEALKCEVSDLLSQEVVSLYSKPNNDSYEDELFRAVIDTVEQIAKEKNISLLDNVELKRKCVQKIFNYARLKNKGNQPTVDKVYAEWAFEKEV